MSKQINLLFPKRVLGRRGGLEKQLVALIQGFLDRNVNVVVLCAKIDPFWRSHPLLAPLLVEVKSSGWTRFGKIRSFENQIHQWILQNKPDIVFGIERTMHATHLRLGDGLHKEYLHHRSIFSRWHPYHRKLLAFEKKIFLHSKTKVFFTNSKMVKESLLRSFSIPSSSVVAIYNGSTPVKEHFLKKPSLLFVGGDFVRKGLFTLLKILKKGDPPLTVIGEDRSILRAKKYAKKHNLNVIFTGHADPTPYYREASHFILPTLYDPFANTTLEALMHGCFVLTTPFNGAHEILTAKSGLIFKEISRAVIQKALSLKRDPKKIASSVEYLSLETQIQKIIAHVFETISHR